MAQGLSQVACRLFRGLAWQAVHQVDIEIVETGGPGRFDGLVGGLGIMDAAQRFQVLWVETLHTDRQPVNAGLPKAGEAAGFQGAGVGLKGNLGVVAKVHALA